LSWIFCEQFPTPVAVQLPCSADVTALLERCSCIAGVFSMASRVIIGNFVKVLVVACRFGSRRLFNRDLPNSITLSRRLKNIELFLRENFERPLRASMR